MEVGPAHRSLPKEIFKVNRVHMIKIVLELRKEEMVQKLKIIKFRALDHLFCLQQADQPLLIKLKFLAHFQLIPNFSKKVSWIELELNSQVDHK